METGLEELKPRRSPPPWCGLLVSLTSRVDRGALTLGTALCVSALPLPAALSPRSVVSRFVPGCSDDTLGALGRTSQGRR